ncbi:MAG TPA: alpha/beta fold hydrolase [Candidatus Microsaccharimonas sp.]|nr:alpha/beta fold hydrolase [Candidatus Microsaccharimonas sp.]
MQTTLQVGERAVQIEYVLAPQMVVFSHGFGVRHDARGLFTDIVAALPKGWGYALFDYDSYDEATKQQHVVGFATRLKELKAVVDWALVQKGVEKLHLVGHSMGSLTIASLAPEIRGEIVLMVPPLTLGSRFVELYNKRPGVEHEGHTWSIPRSDGTTTIVDDVAFAELMSIDAEGELAKLAMFRSYTIVLAGTDEVLPDEDYTDLIVMPSVSMQGIDQADHDFSGRARKESVSIVVRLLQGDKIDAE